MLVPSHSLFIMCYCGIIYQLLLQWFMMLINNIDISYALFGEIKFMFYSNFRLSEVASSWPSHLLMEKYYTKFHSVIDYDKAYINITIT